VTACPYVAVGSWYRGGVANLARSSGIGRRVSRACALFGAAQLAAELVSGSSPAATSTPELAPQITVEPAGPSVAHDASVLALPTTHDHIGRVLVPVTINGQGPFRFVLDTGANHSTISPRLVQTLGLKPDEARSVKLDGITGTALVSFVTVDKLQAGALSLESAMLPVVWAPVMGGADGILGAAGLSEKTLMIDFLRNRVVIAHSVETGMRSDSTRIHAAHVANGLLILDTQVGRVAVRAVIDTGSERTLGNIALRNALKTNRGAGTMAYVTSVYGATEQVEPGEIQRAPPISLGSLHITDVAIVYGGFHIFEVWGLHDEPAMVIGMDVLGTVAALGIDFKNQDLYVAARVTTDSSPARSGVLGSSAMIR